MCMNVKELRERLGLSQDKFAALLGVAPYTVRRWESGKSQPSPLALKQLSQLTEKAEERG
ncbi:MAG: helix-turn-helix domain-containing protein [Dehalococcoidales bacterium]|nr:helix-turn-helix domain-containing protein [Dehalococcoidales bacterium]